MKRIHFIRGKMKAVVKTERRPGAELKEIDIPKPGPTDVLIKVEIAAICGSDVHRYEWTPSVAASKIRLPLVLGHEYSGRVVEIGNEVKALKPGDRVAGETHIPCGHCFLCQTGSQHICRNMGLVGTTVNGCFAEYVLIPGSAVRRVPPELSADLAALLEPLGVAVHAIQRAEVSGKAVAVLGCGPIGLFAVAAAKALGAVKVFATSRSKGKLELAEKMGADLAVDAARDDAVDQIVNCIDEEIGGVDAVIELSGSGDALMQGFEMLRKGGRIILVGQPPEPVEIELTQNIITKEAEVIGIHGRRMWSTWLIAENLLTSKKIDILPVLSAKFPLEEFEKAFEANAELPGKVALLPGE